MFILILFFWRIAWRWPWSLETFLSLICFARPPQNAQPRLPRQYPGVGDAIFSYIFHPLRLGKGMAIPCNSCTYTLPTLTILMSIGNPSFKLPKHSFFVEQKHHHGCDIGRASRPPESPVVSPSWTPRARTERENGSGGISSGYDCRSNTENTVISM